MSIFDLDSKKQEADADTLVKEIREDLLGLDVNHMTPIQALEALFKLQDKAKN